MYSSRHDDEIYQRKPVTSKPSQFPAKGWTDTVEAYIKEAGRLTQCILRNKKLMGRSYTWHITLNVEVVMSPTEVAALWTKVSRKLNDRGIVALWVREPTRNNKVHYHMLVKNEIKKAPLERALKESMPPRKEVGWHKSVRAVKDDWRLAHYITKAKIAGRIKGKEVDDYYRRKRLLFKTNVKIRKVGTIGSFWEKPKPKIQADISEVNRKVRENLERFDVQLLVQHVRHWLGDDVPLKRIERGLALNADQPRIQQWIRELFPWL